MQDFIRIDWPPIGLASQSLPESLETLARECAQVGLSQRDVIALLWRQGFLSWELRELIAREVEKTREATA